MRKKVILFDMDGVIINSEPQHRRAWTRVYECFGITLDPELYKTIIGKTNNSLAELVEREYGFTEKKPAELLQDYRACSRQILDEEGNIPAEGLTETLRELKRRGYRMLIASSSPVSDIVEVIADTGISEMIDAYVSGEQVAHPKPAPDTFLAAAEKAGALPEECVVVEDSHNGVLAAKAAGITCIGLKNPDSGNQDLSLADRIIDHFPELLTIL